MPPTAASTASPPARVSDSLPLRTLSAAIAACTLPTSNATSKSMVARRARAKAAASRCSREARREVRIEVREVGVVVAGAREEEEEEGAFTVSSSSCLPLRERLCIRTIACSARVEERCNSIGALPPSRCEVIACLSTSMPATGDAVGVTAAAAGIGASADMTSTIEIDEPRLLLLLADQPSSTSCKRVSRDKDRRNRSGL